MRLALMKVEPFNRLHHRPVCIEMHQRGTKAWIGIGYMIGPCCKAIAVIAEEGLKRVKPDRRKIGLVLGKLEERQHEPRAAKGIYVRLHKLKDVSLYVNVIAVRDRAVIRIRTEIQSLVGEPSRGQGFIGSIAFQVAVSRAQGFSKRGVILIQFHAGQGVGVKRVTSTPAKDRLTFSKSILAAKFWASKELDQISIAPAS